MLYLPAAVRVWQPQDDKDEGFEVDTTTILTQMGVIQDR